ncbi:MAG: hypothetical protein JXM79_25335 [Sedimentisphaerales bacterium]|nr:hypothetical protein [Sedimentisphaerales bacterium]
MKKTIVSITVLAALGAVAFFLLFTSKTQQSEPIDTPIEEHAEDFIEPEQETFVFEMTYRGLGLPKDEPLYNTSVGYSGSNDANDSSFIQALKAKVENLQTISNFNFRGAKWSAIELEGRNPVAFYFDLNADGKMSDDEKILPLPESEWLFKNPEFITPDFMMNTRDGRQVPFRVLLRVHCNGRLVDQTSPPDCTWSPHCVLEGTSVIDGKTATLILFADDTSGSFTKFGSGSYSLHIGDEKKEETERFKSNPLLSRIIHHNGIFYHLNLIGNHEKGQTIRAELKKYSGPISDVAVKMIERKPFEFDLDFPWGIACKEKSLYFKVSGDRFKLPAGLYEFTKGHMSYGVENENQWTVLIEDLEKEVGPGQVDTIELGQPVLSVTAIDVDEQKKNDAKNQSVFLKGTKIRFTRTIRGTSGELYDRFYQNHLSAHGGKRVDPKIRIVDSDGGEITPGKAEYG